MSRLHRPIILAAELAVVVAAGTLAFTLRFDFAIPASYQKHLWWGLAVWVPVKLAVFRLAGLDRGWGRFASLNDLLWIAFANLASTTFSTVILLVAGPHGFPRSIYLIDMLLTFLGLACTRAAIRLMVERAAAGECGGPQIRTLIYGAGWAGEMLVREIRANPRLRYDVAGFIDDDPGKRGLRLQGARVLGTGEDLGTIVRKHCAEQVLVSIPSASGAQMTAIIGRCRAAGVTCRTVPGMAEVLEDGPLAGQIRDVDVEDLLGRNPVRLEVDRIRARLEGKVVVVTGAAGSIGSEICRQVARFSPRGIVGFEVAETALFHLEREMRASFPQVAFHPEIGNVQNAARVAEVIEAHRPALVFHAAAYKHVPMMEAHLFEAVENNVFGTCTVARECARQGVAQFVMISTDKAVRPTSVMGATKRLAELVVNGLQNGTTRFCSVRFGNVLGSNGSVIPLFKQQIQAGGPVTVTHPEMRRFFMTIPEASQLVLQAAALGEGGEIFVLDMGEPVRVVDLATNLILLSGLRPGEDIRIEFTGPRPGEKLYEEVAAMEESTVPTAHEKIRVFVGPPVRPHVLEKRLEELEEICSHRDVRRLVMFFKDMVPEYNPSSHILTRAFDDRRFAARAAAAGAGRM